MTKAEFEALKAKVQAQKEKGTDFDKMVKALSALAKAVWVLLPAEVREVLAKYGYGEE
jgi:hypothetical protein